jgi:uncharacterized repeat protein (TIGR03803 family)
MTIAFLLNLADAKCVVTFLGSIATMNTRLGVLRAVAVVRLATIVVAAVTQAAVASDKIVHNFQGGSDGESPYAGLIEAKSGNMVGTTSGGGGNGCAGTGCGTVFELAPDGTETVLYAFQGGSDGAGPSGLLLQDASGDVYGATGSGGNSGWGTVFKLAANGTENVLYAFQGGRDGLIPQGGLIADKSGNLYGTTEEGGFYNNSACSEFGCGTVFEVQPNGTKTTLYVFQGGSDGQWPDAGVTADASGNLYGTTSSGGSCNINPGGCGTVFKIAQGGTKTVVYTFQGSDGYMPLAGLISDHDGNLYGTTYVGGDYGNVYEVSPGGTETVLYAFKGGTDGANPEASLVMDKAGNLYGTTTKGGNTRCSNHQGCGTVFELTHGGKEKALYVFTQSHGQFPHGLNPMAGLLLGKKGTLYGTTPTGGTSNDGVVFSIKN